VLGWVQALSKLGTPSSLSDLQLVLFDSKTKSLATEFIERRIGSIFLVEKDRLDSDKLKVNQDYQEFL
jgi:hypothetical protein